MTKKEKERRGARRKVERKRARIKIERRRNSALCKLNV
jgi:hypothetical protein